MEIAGLVRRNLVTVGPTQSLTEAARHMAARNVGAAVVLSDEAPGIISERDVLRAVAEGADPERTTVADYMTWNAVVATTHWDVATAARTMIQGGFRHLLVVDEGHEVGILSIRDLVVPLFDADDASSVRPGGQNST